MFIFMAKELSNNILNRTRIEFPRRILLDEINPFLGFISSETGSTVKYGVSLKYELFGDFQADFRDKDEDIPYVSVSGNLFPEPVMGENMVHEDFVMVANSPFERGGVDTFKFVGIIPGLDIEDHNFAYWDSVREIIEKYFK